MKLMQKNAIIKQAMQLKFPENVTIYVELTQDDIPGARMAPRGIKCLHSCLSQDGGANILPNCSENIPTLKMWKGRPQLSPKIFKIELKFKYFGQQLGPSYPNLQI